MKNAKCRTTKLQKTVMDRLARHSCRTDKEQPRNTNTLKTRLQKCREAAAENAAIADKIEHALGLSPGAALVFLCGIAEPSSRLRMACCWIERGISILSGITQKCPEAARVLSGPLTDNCYLTPEERKGDWEFVEGCDCLVHGVDLLLAMISERTVGAIMAAIYNSLESLHSEDFRFLRTFLSLVEARQFGLSIGPERFKEIKQTIEEGLSKEDYGLPHWPALDAVSSLVQVERTKPRLNP